MIYDLPSFVLAEFPYWEELQALLKVRENDPHSPMGIAEARRFHYLYQRAAADLARFDNLAVRPEAFVYLESVVSRAYSEIQDVPERGKFVFKHWFLRQWPQTFRRHFGAFLLSVVLTIVGAAFGAGALAADPTAKRVLMPFSGLMGDPGERVRNEEQSKIDRLGGRQSTFSAQLMTHNIQVSLFVLALGMTWGVGSILILFYNGVILGAVAFDYSHAGYAPFLLGWLLPHGVIEIPAILVAGQAAFVLATALLGWGDPVARIERLRRVLPDVVTLAGGLALMLVWAGIIEAFVSQYHQPVLPYFLKIAFGAGELLLLTLFFLRAGRSL